MGQPWKEMLDDSSTENHPTPSTTHSAVSESMPLRKKHAQKDDEISRIEFQPRDNGTFLIRTRRKPHFFLSLYCGELKLLPTPAGGSYWKCVKRRGWFGLRNTVSGLYISHDEKGQIDVVGCGVGYRESFTECRDPNGGYILKQLKCPSEELEGQVFGRTRVSTLSLEEPLTKHLGQYVGLPHELIEVSISKDEKSLVHQKAGGTAWDFIETKYIKHSTWLQCPGIQPEELLSVLG